MLNLAIILGGLASIGYGYWATKSLLAADAGNARMQEIATAIQEGAQAYLTRQYTTIGIAGAFIFALVWYLLGALVAVRSPPTSAATSGIRIWSRATTFREPGRHA